MEREREWTKGQRGGRMEDGDSLSICPKLCGKKRGQVIITFLRGGEEKRRGGGRGMEKRGKGKGWGEERGGEGGEKEGGRESTTSDSSTVQYNPM